MFTVMIRSFSLFAVLGLTAATLTACSTSDDPAASADAGNTSAVGSCDPLAAKDITLGAIVGVGQDSAGTLYVDSANGIFVSGNGKMIRQHVVGSGESGSSSGITEYSFDFQPAGDDGSGARTLLVETKDKTVTAMALGPADSKGFLGESDAGLTPLILVDATQVTAMPVVNTPNEISYVGDVENGNVILATYPMNGDSIAQFSGLAIYYGPSTAVAQRVITDFGQTHSNSGTVTFLVDGVPYVLAFGMDPSTDASPVGKFALKGLTPQGGTTLATTIRDPKPTALPPGMVFTCLQ